MPSTADPAARRRRVPAMAPDERRAALIAATVPLLREHGPAVSTRQIAEAAGVAEGTIFGVFPDKPSLLRAAVISAFDPDPVVRALGEIRAGADLRQRLTEVAEIVSQRFAHNEPLLAAVRSLAMGAEGAGEVVEHLHRSRHRIVEAITSVIEPDRAALRRSPATAARQLMLWTSFATRRGFLDEDDPLDSAEIVTLLLDGLLVRPSHPRGDPA